MDTIVRLKFPPEPKQINQTIELTNEQARKPEEPKQINQTIERTNEQPRKPVEQWLLTTVFALFLIGYFFGAGRGIIRSLLFIILFIFF